MGITSVIAPRVDLAERFSGRLLAARDDVRQLSTLFDQNHFPVVAFQGDAAIARANSPEIVELTRGLNKVVSSLAVKRLNSATAPQGIQDVQRAAVEIVLAVTPDKGVDPASVGMEAKQVRGMLSTLLSTIESAHTDLATAEVAQQLKEIAPRRRLATTTRVVLLTGAVAGGGIAATEQGRDAATDIANQAVDRARKFIER